MATKKVWLITGASKGLGLALVQRLLKEGYKVAATSRDAAALSLYFLQIRASPGGIQNKLDPGFRVLPGLTTGIYPLAFQLMLIFSEQPYNSCGT
jgi:NAD(P)-dependent dehydrogenase (short-subunit alcohol dehydrogenase family)